MLLEKLLKKHEGKNFIDFTVNENGTLVLTNEKEEEIRSRCYIVSTSIGRAVLINNADVSGTTLKTEEAFAVLSADKLFLNENEWFSFKKLHDQDKHFLALVLNEKGMMFSYYCSNMRTPIIHQIEGLDRVQELIVLTLNLLALYNTELSTELKQVLFKLPEKEDCNESE